MDETNYTKIMEPRSSKIDSELTEKNSLQARKLANCLLKNLRFTAPDIQTEPCDAGRVFSSECREQNAVAERVDKFAHRDINICGAS